MNRPMPSTSWPRVHSAALVALAALWLSACGGGGSDGAASAFVATSAASPVPSAPAPVPSPAPAPAPTPAPAPAMQQLVANGSYTVSADGTQAVVLTLPRNEDLQVGDTVRVVGQGNAPWRLAQNAQQSIATAALPGNVVPGTAWTARTPDPALPAQNWAALAASGDGNRIAAAAAGAGISISNDGGATWMRSDAPAAAWTALAMSADGHHAAAVAADGLLFTSGDGGQTWTARTSAPQAWTGVFLSADGTRVVGAIKYGSLVLSTDGGATFTAVPGTGATDWRAVAGSADGLRLLAVAAHDPGFEARQGVYVSADGGLTWVLRPVTGPTPPTGNWSFAAASASGQRMAALDNGGNPWVSDDGGSTWSMRFGYSNWCGLAVSGDGNVVAALEPRDDTWGHTGYVFVSPDGGGATWNWYGENRWYRAVALSLDGNWMVVGDSGPDGAGGGLFTSQGNRTTVGTAGSITGGPGQMLELTYQGDGRFGVSASAGGPFTIR